MNDRANRGGPDEFGPDSVRTLGDLSGAVRKLQRRSEIQRNAKWTLRALEVETGIPRTTLTRYLDGQSLAPADKFDSLIRALGASDDEQARFATARDRVSDGLIAGNLNDAAHTTSELDTDSPQPAPATPGPRWLRLVYLAAAMLVVAIVAIFGWRWYSGSQHASVDPGCLTTCVYLDKQYGVVIRSGPTLDSQEVALLPNRASVTMLCWTDSQEARRPDTNYRSTRWFKLRSGSTTGFAPSGTVFTQTHESHC
jgi:hypothetical protein